MFIGEMNMAFKDIRRHCSRFWFEGQWTRKNIQNMAGS